MSNTITRSCAIVGCTIDGNYIVKSDIIFNTGSFFMDIEGNILGVVYKILSNGDMEIIINNRNKKI